MNSKTNNPLPLVESTALFGSSDWRAEGWESIKRAAKTGDRIQGLRKDGEWHEVTVRVLEGTMEGRHPIRFVYVGWEEKGRGCECTLECFATMHLRIESLPNAELRDRPESATPPHNQPS